MALFRGNSEGYATVSALVLSMAIALVVAGSMAVAGADLQAARRELRRVQQEAWFDSVHLRATYQVATTAGADRIAWQDSWGGTGYQVLAETETSKASLHVAASNWDDAAFRALGVDPERVRPLLTGFSSRERAEILEIDPAPTWRSCILSLVSVLGTDSAPDPVAPVAPGASEVDWRTGQVWRIRIRGADGWTDDRLVRWSGDGRAPVYVIDRQLYRLRESRVPCESIVQ